MSTWTRTRFNTTILALVAVILAAAAPAGGNELRVLTLGGARIAFEDEDTRLNPYDFGRNAAYLLLDYERSWRRFHAGLGYEEGLLKRDYDPKKISDLRLGASGLKRLGDRHVIQGAIHYDRQTQKEVSYSLERDQYNDPFYMTDATTGTFDYAGPTMSVDYSLRLASWLYIGAGLDYDLSTGLKDTYTRPEIVHDHFMANLGAIVELGSHWAIGVIARPVRTQNRTAFDATAEGYDNLIYRRYGDAVYDVYTIGSGTAREVLKGYQVGAQNFFMFDRLQVGVQATFGERETEIEYGGSKRLVRGMWQSTVYEADVVARYRMRLFPWTIGVRFHRMEDDSWGMRPDHDEVVLYENPLTLNSAGGGITWPIQPLGLLASAEYVMNHWKIEAFDHGAGLVRKAKISSNIGRLGLEYSMRDVHYVRAGFEYTDFLVDRWLKLPVNTDRYRVTAGFQYRTGYWDFDVMVGYNLDTKQNFDAEREAFFGAIWLTGLID
jgi:hypothetical protein